MCQRCPSTQQCAPELKRYPSPLRRDDLIDRRPFTPNKHLSPLHRPSKEIEVFAATAKFLPERTSKVFKDSPPEQDVAGTCLFPTNDGSGFVTRPVKNLAFRCPRWSGSGEAWLYGSKDSI